MVIIGIDPSITGTAVTATSPDLKSIKGCFFTEVKKYGYLPYDFIDSFIVPKSQRDDGDIPFYESLTNAIIDKISEFIGDDDFRIAIEGYSFSSTGKVFSIAEFIGLLKWKMHIVKRWKYTIVPPAAWKKHIYKGNSNKDDLFKEFTRRHVDIIRKVNPTWVDEWFKFINDENLKFKLTKIGSPLGDLMDSLYIAMHTAREYEKNPL